ncbi:hypothetical protein [Psychrobacter sp. I-STPA10]|uniref:hypothetical protein n=1 Tax=Psychrobacter sp. I-STPA10 TaxID=2585769 RepID=UPI001E65E219|nr:hypothetical protein [Psychrobacter sp. I-STPA10]
MSFLKDLGKGLGEVTGAVLGGTIKGAGEILDSKFVQEVGTGVEKSMTHTGTLLGELADGIADVGIGCIDKNEQQTNQGLNNLGNTIKTFGSQVGQSATTIVDQGITTVDALSHGDYETAKIGVAGLAKVAAVSVLAVGVIDIIDGVDAIDSNVLAVDDTTDTDYIQVENTNIHEVSPHERVLADGRVIWVDGDGDTSINRDTGWVQTNPNYRIST